MTIEDINIIRLALATPEHNTHYEKHATDAHKILNKAEDIARVAQNLSDIDDVVEPLLTCMCGAKTHDLNGGLCYPCWCIKQDK